MAEPRRSAQRRADTRRAGTVFVNPNRVEGGRSGSLAHVLNALRRVPGLEVVECPSTPPQCIAIGASLSLLSTIWTRGNPPRRLTEARSVEVGRRSRAPDRLQVSIPFGDRVPAGDDQFWLFLRERRPGLAPGSPPAGSPGRRLGEDADQRLWHARTDLRLADGPRDPRRGGGTDGSGGREAGTGKIDHADYHEELFDTEIGFDWRGCGRLTRRIGVNTCGPAW